MQFFGLLLALSLLTLGVSTEGQQASGSTIGIRRHILESSPHDETVLLQLQDRAQPGQDGQRGTNLSTEIPFTNLNEAVRAAASLHRIDNGNHAHILILLVGDADRFGSKGPLEKHFLAWGCYGNRWGAPVRYVDPASIPTCAHHPNWFFRRLCSVRLLVDGFLNNRSNLLSLTQIPDWIFHFDGDTIPFNTDLSPSSLVSSWGGMDMVFYERYHNGEIVAGNYALRICQFALQFMRAWESAWTDVQQANFSNSDNGALHLCMVNQLKDELEDPQIDRIRNLYHQSTDLATYDRYVASAKLALGQKRVFNHILIQRRAHGFCEDDSFFDISSQKGNESARFLCVHGIKTETDLRDTVQECVESVSQCSASLMACKSKPNPTVDLVKGIRSHSNSRMSLGPVDGVADCWPDCPADLPAKLWQQIKIGLQKNVDCPTPACRRSCCCAEP